MGRSSLEKLYLRYCYELGYLPRYKQNPSKVHSLLKDELLKCEMYSEEAKFLAKHSISDLNELAKHKEMILTGIGSLEEDRDKLRLKAKRKIPEDERSLCKQEIAGLTCELRELRKELKLVEDIEKRSPAVKKQLEQIEKERNKEVQR